MTHENIIVILVEPQGPINVGSVCRVMMNFGFNKLRLVNPCRSYKSLLARKMALSAQEMLINAQIFNTLSDALRDCHVAFGTTRRFGKYRSQFFTPDAASKAIAQIDNNTQCALVLGREDNGLTADELSLCQHFITIPTDDAFASMNLSHALAILLYEISNSINKSDDQLLHNKSYATIESLEQMYCHIKRALCDIEFLDPQNPEHLLRAFRSIFGKAGLSERDVRIIRGLMSKIEWVNSQRATQSVKSEGELCSKS
ncbi:MAG: RNA methyltransferase [Desulfamplus sp.]|nr:RNA methyltransferase [Desulfamplus sp.]